ncbi:MAG: M1 family aminopeptidase, partial [Gammaproteobacteria bacterium]|nr:M1 family aminopeptidase [Gammaproteobacteria bacterium]
SFEAETSITFSSTIDSLDALTLDAETFTVNRVTRQGKSLDFTHRDGSLDISLDREMSTGEEATLVISYGVTNIDIDSTEFGMGAGYDLGFNFNPGSATNPPLIHTLNFPEGARHWIPSFDHPGDWATHDTIVTVREDYSVVANGALVSDTVDAGRRTVHWSQAKPQPTYLYVLVAGNYSILEDNYGDLPLNYWVYPGEEVDARLSFASTPRMVAFFEELYGVDYPWVKYDQVVIPGIGGGAESTSATVISEWTVMNSFEMADESPDALIAHELAHQWWGDMIGYRDWQHMWLSESFATHAEVLWALHDLGADEAAYALEWQKDAYLREAKTRFIRPIVTNKWNRPNEMFDRHTYEKGGIVLNMFRELVGKEMFGNILQSFLETHAYQNVTTADFFNTVRQTTGEDYGWFFDQWLLKPGHPVLAVTWEWDDDRDALSVTVNQEQDRSLGTPVFRLPLEIGITTSSGKTVEETWLDEAQQTFSFEIGEEPLMVRIDDRDALLKELRFEKSTTELLYELRHASATGRRWAAGELGARMRQPGVLAALIAASQDDDFWWVRERAVQVLGSASSESATEPLKVTALEDTSSRVRAAALESLALYDDESFTTFFRDRHAAEESPLARAAANSALEKLATP